MNVLLYSYLSLCILALPYCARKKNSFSTADRVETSITRTALHFTTNDQAIPEIIEMAKEEPSKTQDITCYFYPLNIDPYTGLSYKTLHNSRYEIVFADQGKKAQLLALLRPKNWKPSNQNDRSPSSQRLTVNYDEKVIRLIVEISPSKSIRVDKFGRVQNGSVNYRVDPAKLNDFLQKFASYGKRSR